MASRLMIRKAPSPPKPAFRRPPPLPPKPVVYKSLGKKLPGHAYAPVRPPPAPPKPVVYKSLGKKLPGHAFFPAKPAVSAKPGKALGKAKPTPMSNLLQRLGANTAIVPTTTTGKTLGVTTGQKIIDTQPLVPESKIAQAMVAANPTLAASLPTLTPAAQSAAAATDTTPTQQTFVAPVITPTTTPAELAMQAASAVTQAAQPQRSSGGGSADSGGPSDGGPSGPSGGAPQKSGAVNEYEDVDDVDDEDEDEEDEEDEQEEETDEDEDDEDTVEGEEPSPFPLFTSHVQGGRLRSAALCCTQNGLDIVTACIKLPRHERTPDGPAYLSHFGEDTIRRVQKVITAKADDAALSLVAGSVVERAREGDQNAMAIIAGVRDNAARGDQRASKTFGVLKNYIEAHPVDSEMGFDDDDNHYAMIILANGPPLTKALIRQVVDALEPYDRHMVIAGIQRRHEATTEKSMQIGQTIGKASALQHLRRGGPVTPFDPVIGWELGE